MSKEKKPKDINQLAKYLVDKTTGQNSDSPKKQIPKVKKAKGK